MSSPQDPNAKLDRAARDKESGLVRELWTFIIQNKKWWLIPLVAALVLVGGLVMLGGTGLAPFIYSLF